MPSKLDRFCAAWQRMPAYACPVCGQTMKLIGMSLTCGKGHSFNVNKKGCVNFLTRKSESFYNEELFAARRRVFLSGCYLPVVKDMDDLLSEGTRCILDAGCGEGWYLNEILGRHPESCGAGIDLSKDAILQATDQPCDALWTVGDLRRLPFVSGTFDAVLNVLTPAAYHEFARVLSPSGVLIKVYPGREYLRQLREARGLPLYEEGDVAAHLSASAVIERTIHVAACQPVTEALWADAVSMSPINQDLTAQEKEEIARHPAKEITIDLWVTRCRLPEQQRSEQIDQT